MKIRVATLYKLISDFFLFQEMRGKGDTVEKKVNRLIWKDTGKKIQNYLVHMVVLHCTFNGKKSDLLLLPDSSAVGVAELTEITICNISLVLHRASQRNHHSHLTETGYISLKIYRKPRTQLCEFPN